MDWGRVNKELCPVLFKVVPFNASHIHIVQRAKYEYLWWSVNNFNLRQLQDWKPQNERNNTDANGIPNFKWKLI